MKCNACNTTLPISAKFCRKCGVKVNYFDREDNCNIKICPKCGTRNHNHANFCRYDGFNLQENSGYSANDPVNEDIVVCPECGDEYSREAKFCRRDGTKLQSVVFDENILKTTEYISEEKLKEITPDSLINNQINTHTETTDDIVSDENIDIINETKDTLTKTCPKCGTNNHSNAMYCRFDGYKFEDEKEKEHDMTPVIDEQPTFVVCKKCGSIYDAGTKFCRNDGANLEHKNDHTDIHIIEQHTDEQKTEGKTLHREYFDIQTDRKDILNTPNEHFSNINRGKYKNGMLRTFILRKKSIIYIITTFAILIGCGAFFFVNILFTNNQDEVGIRINSDLKNNGLNVTCMIDENWFATLKGMTKSRADKLKAIEISNSNNNIRFTKSEIISLLSPAEMKSLIDSSLISAGLMEIISEVDDNRYVNLKGYANSITEKSKAVQIASDQGQTKNVTDNIQIKDTSLVNYDERKSYHNKTEHDSARLQYSLNKALRYAGLNGVSATISDNYLTTLKGSVTSEKEKKQAFSIARSFVKIKVLRDKIFVVQ